MIGFLPSSTNRTPVYTSASRKVGYMSGAWFVDLEGRKVALIIRYHIDLPDANASVSGSHLITPESCFEG